jgi:hypothetical protein
MFIVLIVAAAALYIGWHFSRAHMAHRAIPGRRAQLGPLRRDRTHHVVWSLVMLLVIVLLVIVLVVR